MVLHTPHPVSPLLSHLEMQSWRLEEWLSSEELIRLLEGSRVWFPEPTFKKECVNVCYNLSLVGWEVETGRSVVLTCQLASPVGAVPGQ